jgi:hypothetical protein
VSCIAWLPSTRADTSIMRRNSRKRGTPAGNSDGSERGKPAADREDEAKRLRQVGEPSTNRP